MKELLVLAPGLSILGVVAELPEDLKEKFYRIPPWISSTVIALAVGAVGRGVLGPTTGFVTEIILTIGFYVLRYFYRKRKAREKARMVTSAA